RDYPDPELRPDDVLLRIHACGLNHFDIFIRRGMPGWPVAMPFISGGDIAGEIVAVGPEVRTWKVGERCIVQPEQPDGMMGEVINGGMAEYCRVPSDYLIRLDARLAYTEAASVPVNYGTAHHMLLTNGGIREGELVLVLGASGGVGTATVQVAKARGCRVIACAGTAEKCRRLSALGADYTINYTAEDFSREAWRISGKKGVDVCVNYTGGSTWVPSIRAIRHKGKLITCGATAGFDPKTDIRYIWQRELSIIGSNSYSLEDIRLGMVGVTDGTYKLPEIRVFPMSQLGTAEELMESREFFGKLVLVPDAVMHEKAV
ncbi:MAG: zinc-binding dehydrogenase, partial [Acetobacteraceae bacterium]